MYLFQSEGYLGDEQILEEEPCYGKRCTSNEHCCPGSVCVDVDGGNFFFLFLHKNSYSNKTSKNKKINEAFDH